MMQFKNSAVLLAVLVLSVGCSEILTDYSFYSPDGSDDDGCHVGRAANAT